MHFIILANKKETNFAVFFSTYFLLFRIAELPIKMYFVTLRNKRTPTNKNATQKKHSSRMPSVKKNYEFSLGQ